MSDTPTEITDPPLYTFTLTPLEANIAVMHMGKGQYDVVQPVIEKMQQQAKEQREAAAQKAAEGEAIAQ